MWFAAATHRESKTNFEFCMFVNLVYLTSFHYRSSCLSAAVCILLGRRFLKLFIHQQRTCLLDGTYFWLPLLISCIWLISNLNGFWRFRRLAFLNSWRIWTWCHLSPSAEEAPLLAFTYFHMLMTISDLRAHFAPEEDTTKPASSARCVNKVSN